MLSYTPRHLERRRTILEILRPGKSGLRMTREWSKSSQHPRLASCNGPVLPRVLPDEIGALLHNSPFPSHLKRRILEEVRRYPSHLNGEFGRASLSLLNYID